MQFGSEEVDGAFRSVSLSPTQEIAGEEEAGWRPTKRFGLYPRDSGELLKGLNRGCDRPVLLFSGSFWLLWGEWPGVSLRGFQSGRESQVRGLCLVAVIEMRTQTTQREIYRQNSHDLEQ